MERNLSSVEIYQIWDNVSNREQQLEAQLFKYSTQCMAEFPLSPRRCISHTVCWYHLQDSNTNYTNYSEHGGHIIIYLILQETTNKIIVFAALTKYKEYQ